MFGEINQNTTFVIDMCSGSRSKGNPGYLSSFGDSEAAVDVSEAKYVPEGIRLMTRSVGAPETEEAEEITRYESKSGLVKPSEGRVHFLYQNI